MCKVEACALESRIKLKDLSQEQGLARELTSHPVVSNNSPSIFNKHPEAQIRQRFTNSVDGKVAWLSRALLTHTSKSL